MVKYDRGEKMFKIGNIEIKNNIVLAPMAGVCDSAFRTIIKEMGCGLIYSEMISDKGLIYNSKKTEDMLHFEEKERPIAIQLFGSDIDSFVQAAKKVYHLAKPDIIDINMGCPVPKVAIKSQAGSSLLKNPKKVGEIVKAVVAAVACPVTVKIRSGWDKNSINAVEIAKICEKSGASAITVHGRTRSEGYSGKCDLDIIKQVKASVKIPVIGNGDIVDIKTAQEMFEYTKCDAIMIGRGTLGNPWLIKELIAYFEENKKIAKPTIEQKINMCLYHLEKLLKIKKEKQAILQMRSIVAWYLKGLPNTVNLKNEVFKTTTKENLQNLLNNYLKEQKNDIK